MEHGGDSAQAGDAWAVQRWEAAGVTLSVTRAAVVAGNAAAPLMTQETRRFCVFDHQESTFHALTSLARNSMMVAGFFFLSLFRVLAVFFKGEVIEFAVDDLFQAI